MNRDTDILRVFEIADDSLQGVLGYHFYVIATQRDVNKERITQYLPDQCIPHTFSWVRFYRKQDLTNAFRPPIFELFQSRISLIAMTNVFEVALENFIRYLNQKGHPQFLKRKRLLRKAKEKLSYKTCITWAYNESRKCDIGDREAIKRLPLTFGIIDNARRLRNLIVHNHGLFNTFYEEDAINSDGVVKDLHPHYKQIFKKKPQRPTPVIMTTEYIIRFSRAHIEVLHVLHNRIQKQHFGFSKAYSYRREKKGIEWNRVLWGSAKVKILMTKNES